MQPSYKYNVNLFACVPLIFPMHQQIHKIQHITIQTLSRHGNIRCHIGAILTWNMDDDYHADQHLIHLTAIINEWK